MPENVYHVRIKRFWNPTDCLKSIQSFWISQLPISTAHLSCHVQVYFAKHYITSNLSSLVESRFSFSWFLVFTKSRTAVEREETSDCGQNEGEHGKAGDDEPEKRTFQMFLKLKGKKNCWEKGVRDPKEDWLRCH